ncbi:MAG: carbohydrate-binding protein, partial [Cyclobacteriaceae bacterium]|nr:carbohydrate-binding protein [Cyclobacteriaceae bacterium]
GEVGPDAGKDGRYGPQSYDEWNQAKTPGNYGWPYFEADNKAFPHRNFETDEVGDYFDPEHPINESPNNTGSRELPPARPAIVWYPYGESEEFPMLGTGSRSAMGGPFYYPPKQKSEVAFPDYYEGKWFIFEWARSWIKVMTFDEDANLTKIEPFLNDFQFSKPIDIKFGQDGAMYVADYGANYFANNEDARLLKIEYRKENIPPTAIIATIATNENMGAAPFTIQLSAENSFDFDKNDEISYQWFIKGENEAFSTDLNTSYTFNSIGNYTIVLEVHDKNGDKGIAQQLVRIGNNRPKVSIEVDGNRSFYFRKSDKLNYKVSVTDAEDGSTENKTIASSDVNVQFNYMNEGTDMANISPEMFEGASIQYIKGKNLIDGSDCKSCHDVSKKSIGPAYMAIANKYKDQYDAVPLLAEKIIKGGKGVWGEGLMAAHPQHTIAQTEEMVKYILSLMEDKKGLDIEGVIAFNQHKNREGFYVLSANYADKVNNEIGPLVGRNALFFRSPRLEAEDYEKSEHVMRMSPPLSDIKGFLVLNEAGGWFAFNNIDLQGISKMEVRLRVIQGGNLKLISRPGAEELGNLELKENKEWHTLEIPVSRGFLNQMVIQLVSGEVEIDYVELMMN